MEDENEFDIEPEFDVQEDQITLTDDADADEVSHPTVSQKKRETNNNK